MEDLKHSETSVSEFSQACGRIETLNELGPNRGVRSSRLDEVHTMKKR
jgi:hypothetical protein